MSERGFWDDNLLELQQKYWESWSEINRKASGVEGSSANSPWEMAQEHWWQAVSQAAPDVTKDFMTRMMDQGKQFFRMAELFTGQPGGEAPDWMGVLNQLSADLGSRNGMGVDPQSNDQLYKMLGFWALPLDSWQRIASMLSILPGDLSGNTLHGGPESNLNRLFSAPGLGYSREEQQQQQKLLQLMREYQQALQDYSRFFSDIGNESIQRLRDRLKQNSVEGEAIDSARALYDTWVTTCEEVYSEHVITPEYARINGQLVNASMGVKQQVGSMVDEKLGFLNMPTRRELRTIHTRMQENRRENKRLQAELELLKGQVAGLLAGQATAGPAPAAVRRKTVPRKKSTVKKKRNYSNETN